MTDHELIDKLLDGTLSKDEYARLRKKVNSMSDSQIVEWIDSSSDNRECDIPEEAFDRVRNGLHAEIRHTLWRRRLSRWTVVAAMIMVPLLLAGMLYFYHRSARLDAYDNMLGSTTSIATGEDESMTVILPDGTKAFMEPVSTIDYAMSEFSDISRSISFTGEAFFDVVHRDGTPFVIQTEAMTVTVKGTSFLVSAHEGAATMAVYLESGMVELESKLSGMTVTMSPGQYASLDCKDGRFTLSEVDNRNDATAMARGDMIFHDTALKDVLEDIKKQYGVTIRIGCPEMLDQHFTGYIPSGNLDEALDIIGSLLDCTVTPEITPPN